MKMNNEMCTKLGLDQHGIIGSPFEDLLTVGSRIFFQTHFYPLIKMQKSASEIFISFKGSPDPVPVLLNVDVRNAEGHVEIYCGGMIISNRNRFEKELIEAKRIAQEALIENADLIEVKNVLVEQQHELEAQFRKLKSLKEQQQEIFKLITHDLQEPLRKAVFVSNLLLTDIYKIKDAAAEKVHKIIGYNTQMREMLLTLQRFEELENKKLTYGPIDLNAVICQAIFELNIKQDGSTAIFYPEKCPVFYGDKGLLTHFFIELIRNSLDNKDPKKEKLTIEISVLETQKNVFIESGDKYRYERFVKIVYLDNGAGFISDSAKVFQILQKSAQFNKISIGMAFCKRIVEKHMGTIVAKSVKDAGVGYTIFLPINPSARPL